MALIIGGPPPSPKEPEPEQELLPATVHAREQDYSASSMDAALDIDDTGMSERTTELANFDSLPQDEKAAVLAMLELPPEELLVMARQASTLLGHSRESRLAREARLQLVHRMTMKGYPIERMSLTLGISLRRVHDLKKVISSRLKRQMSRMDFGMYAGEQMQEYTALKQLAIGIAEDSTNPMTSRMAAFVLALRAMKDSHVFLQRLGVFKQFNNGDNLITRLQSEMAGHDGAEATLTDIAMAFKKAGVAAIRGEGVLDMEDAELIDENNLFLQGDLIDAAPLYDNDRPEDE